MECHPQDQSPELSTPDNSSSLNALIQESCGEPFPWPGGERGRRFALLHVCLLRPEGGPSICQPDSLVCIQLRSSFKQAFGKKKSPKSASSHSDIEEMTDSSLPSSPKATTQWIHGLHSPALRNSHSVLCKSVCWGHSGHLWPLSSLQQEWRGVLLRSLCSLGSFVSCIHGTLHVLSMF